MGEKITLRSKTNPSITITGTLERKYPEGESSGWEVRLAPNSPWNYFAAEYWEQEPPPFVLPTGLGAVVQNTDSGTVWTRVNEDTWRTRDNVISFPNTLMQIYGESGHLIVLSEGVEV